jgi:hypothetical protein
VYTKDGDVMASLSEGSANLVDNDITLLGLFALQMRKNGDLHGRAQPPGRGMLESTQIACP